MADNASLYSTTETLIDAPLATLLNDVPSGLSDETFLPVEQCWAVLVMTHDRFKADTRLMTRVGFPASYERGSIPGGARSMMDVKKRLQAQIPMRTLENDRIVVSPIPGSVEELRSSRGPAPRTIGRRSTLMFLLREDMVQQRTRLITSAAQTLLFCGSDVNTTTLYYPAHIVLKTPPWAAKKKGGAAAAFASATVKWATCTFTSPAPEGSADLQDDKKSRADRERAILDKILRKESDEEILARLQPRSASSDALLDRLLAHLQCRGVMWSQAAHVCRPSTLNSDPTLRPQFAVQGLYPEAFLDRCKAHCSAGSSVHGKNALKAESSEPSKRQPLILSGDSGVDLLEGWHVKVTPEPYKQGTPMSTAGFLGGQMGAAAVC